MKQRMKHEAAYFPWGKALVFGPVGHFVNAAVFCLTGLGLVAWGLLRGFPHAVIWGLLTAFFAVGATLVLRAEMRLMTRPSRPSVGEDPAGNPATIFPRVGWHLRKGLASIGAVCLALLASATVEIAQGNGPAASVLCAGALFLAGLLVPILRGTVQPGGLYLSRAAITTVMPGGWFRVPWTSVRFVFHEGALYLTLAPDTHIDRGRTTWHPVWWPPRGVAGRDAITFDTRYLLADPATVAAVLERCLRNSAERELLGRAESLVLIAEEERSLADRARPAR
jgi:hypothetical protein